MNRRELLKTVSVMMGAMASGSISRAIIAADTSARTPRKPIFDPETRTLVETLAELIIPTTDTPGAIAAGVPDFVEMMVGEWYSNHERAIFYQGLRDLDSWCIERFGGSFLDSSPDVQTQALQRSEQLASGYQVNAQGAALGLGKVDENTPFFHKIKELVVVGYYTSEVGARQEHRYFLMTPEYDGDYDLARVDGRQWSY
jgi:hypothetical protein